MKKYFLIFSLFATFTSFPLLTNAKQSGFICTERALKFIKSEPQLFTPREKEKIEKDGPENFNPDGKLFNASDWKAVRNLYPQWNARVETFSKKLQEWANVGWWALPLNELQACDIARKLGPVAKDDLYQASHWEGNSNFRILTFADASIASGNGWWSFNTFLLYKRKDGTTQVLEAVDGGTSHADFSSISFQQTNEENPILILSYGSGSLHPTETFLSYRINLETDLVEALPLFKKGNEFSHSLTTDIPIIDDSYKSTKLIRKGNLTKRFPVYDVVIDKIETKYYSWNGQNYKLEGYSKATALNEAQKIKQCRETLRTKFDAEKGGFPCEEAVSQYECSIANDFSFLYYKSKKYDQAMQNAITALRSCTGKEKESAEFNFKRALEKLR